MCAQQETAERELRKRCFELKDLIAKKPKRLFHYQKYNVDWLDDIINGIILLSDPRDFNDIFEFYTLTRTHEIIQRNLLTQLFSVYCLSENCESILSWAHYGDSNKGICVEYDISDYNRPLADIVPVLYEEHLIDCSSFPEFSEPYKLAQRQSVFTKSDVWKYEQEWRLCYHHTDYQTPIAFKRDHDIDAPNFYQFIKPVGITLGADFPKNKTEEILNKCSKTGIEVSKVIRKKDEYALIREPYSIQKFKQEEPRIHIALRVLEEYAKGHQNSVQDQLALNREKLRQINGLLLKETYIELRSDNYLVVTDNGKKALRLLGLCYY